MFSSAEGRLKHTRHKVPTIKSSICAGRLRPWNQCQHQSWYFPPWHRGYLLALEAQIRADVIHLGGPPTWALPYWNYLGPRDEFKIPPAFTQ
jgi:tyrosinase